MQVAVVQGIATLIGQVTSPYKAEAIEELASRVDGIERVVDRLERLPLSGLDDQRLTGLVISELERRKAEQVARSTFGVLIVEKALRVLRRD